MRSIPILLLAALLAGCSTEAARSGAEKENINELLASIQIKKLQPSASTDCPVSVKISNRMNVAWDGVSYQLGALNKNNVATGQIIGAPRQKTKPGSDLAENTQVLGVSCDSIVGVSMLYFAYYPSGKNAVHLHNSQVKAALR